MKWSQEELNKAASEINRRASADADFRKLCLEKPAEALRMVSSPEVPDNVQINIIESASGYDYRIVLPDYDDGELSDETISKIAGGICATHNYCTLDLH